MSIKRILADIGELNSPIYAETRIFYSANEENVREGYACIFGPVGTPYEDCPMLYSFIIDETFPFNPPKVSFKTNDGITRFHPNMYKDGKVCLSILHTWEGPKWSSIMRLSSILLTLQSLMDTEPILHEPGYNKLSKEYKQGYSDYVEYACIQYILERAERAEPDAFKPFSNIFKEQLPAILKRLEMRLKKLLEQGEKTFINLPYQLHGTTNYKRCLERVIKLNTIDL